MTKLQSKPPTLGQILYHSTLMPGGQRIDSLATEKYWEGGVKKFAPSFSFRPGETLRGREGHRLVGVGQESAM